MTSNNSIKQEELRAAFQLLTSDNAKDFSEMLDQNPLLLNCTPAAFGESWLHLAAKSESLNVIEVLVRRGLPVDVVDRDGDTPLSAAMAKPELKAARWLLAHGAAVTGVGEGVLRSAIYSKNLAGVKLIVDSGADVNEKCEDSGDSVLEFAQTYGTPEIVDFLTSRGAAPAIHPMRDFIVQQIETQLGPLKRVQLDDADVDVYMTRASGNQEHVTLLTIDAGDGSRISQGENQSIGLKIMLPINWEADAAFGSSSADAWPIDWLHKFSEKIRSGDLTLRDRFTIISNGEPPKAIASTVKFNAFLLAQDPSPVFNFATENGLVTYYTLFPLYPEEVSFERNSNIPTLLNRFSDAGIGTIVKPDRINVARTGS